MKIFDQTLKLIVENVKTIMNDCYDPIAILLSLHLTYRYQIIANKRNVPTLNTSVEKKNLFFSFFFLSSIVSVSDSTSRWFKSSSLDSNRWWNRTSTVFNASILINSLRSNWIRISFVEEKKTETWKKEKFFLSDRSTLRWIFWRRHSFKRRI